MDKWTVRSKIFAIGVSHYKYYLLQHEFVGGTQKTQLTCCERVSS